MPVWDAEVVVDQRLVRRLLRRFPELELATIEHVAEGWDRSAWLVDGVWIFGFPRRAVVVPGIEREIAFMPRLAPLLPLPVPVPTLVGAPGDEFPWPFFGAPFIPGCELPEAPGADGRAIALKLATFLRHLHGDEVRARIHGDGLPFDANGRADMTVRVPRARAALAELPARDVPRKIARVLDEAEALPPPTRATVVHGDLHVRQLLVHGRRLSGVIDWVDVGRADPAVDLQVLWSVVDPPDREAFLDEYGPVGDDQLLRARALAAWLSAVLVAYARDRGRRTLERAALQGLERAAAE